MHSKPTITFLLLCFCLVAFSQTNEEQAHEKYTAAQQAYNNGKYQTSLDLLIQVRSLLDWKPNIRTQPLFIRSCIKVKHWLYANLGLTEYFAMHPDTTLVEYAEIKGYQPLILTKLKQEKTDYEQIRSNFSVQKQKEFLSNYPHSDYYIELEWLKTTNHGSLSAYYDFMSYCMESNQRKHPRFKEAIDIVHDLDLMDFKHLMNKINEKSNANKALEWTADIEKHLKDYPFCAHQKELDEKINELKGEYFYPRDMYRYMCFFPTGKHINEAKTYCENRFYNECKNIYESNKDDYRRYRKSEITIHEFRKSWGSINLYCLRYLLFFPNGINSAQVNKIYNANITKWTCYGNKYSEYNCNFGNSNTNIVLNNAISYTNNVKLNIVGNLIATHNILSKTKQIDSDAPIAIHKDERITHIEGMDVSRLTPEQINFLLESGDIYHNTNNIIVTDDYSSKLIELKRYKHD